MRFFFWKKYLRFPTPCVGVLFFLRGWGDLGFADGENDMRGRHRRKRANLKTNGKPARQVPLTMPVPEARLDGGGELFSDAAYASLGVGFRICW